MTGVGPRKPSRPVTDVSHIARLDKRVAAAEEVAGIARTAAERAVKIITEIRAGQKSREVDGAFDSRRLRGFDERLKRAEQATERMGVLSAYIDDVRNKLGDRLVKVEAILNDLSAVSRRLEETEQSLTTVEATIAAKRERQKDTLDRGEVEVRRARLEALGLVPAGRVVGRCESCHNIALWIYRSTVLSGDGTQKERVHGVCDLHADQYASVRQT